MSQIGLMSYRNIFKFKRFFKGGRNTSGRITFFRSGCFYHKQKHFNTVLPSQTHLSPFIVKKDYPNRFYRDKAFVNFFDGSFSVIPVAKKLKPGQVYYNEDFKNYGELSFYKFGSHVSWLNFCGNRYASARGSFCNLFFEFVTTFLIILPSGFIVFLKKNILCFFDDKIYLKKFFLKKGAKMLRIKGKSPSVRGTAKNPNDHPHGGRTRSILKPMTPWCKNIPRKNNKRLK